jgi:hypothetical protein
MSYEQILKITTGNNIGNSEVDFPFCKGIISLKDVKIKGAVF